MITIKGFANGAYWALASVGAVYALLMGGLTRPWLQRELLYLNRIHTGWWNNVSKPESFGFPSRYFVPSFRSSLANKNKKTR